jgi:hypothetical protein
MGKREKKKEEDAMIFFYLIFTPGHVTRKSRAIKEGLT